MVSACLPVCLPVFSVCPRSGTKRGCVSVSDAWLPSIQRVVVPPSPLFPHSSPRLPWCLLARARTLFLWFSPGQLSPLAGHTQPDGTHSITRGEKKQEENTSGQLRGNNKRAQCSIAVPRHVCQSLGVAFNALLGTYFFFHQKSDIRTFEDVKSLRVLLSLSWTHSFSGTVSSLVSVETHFLGGAESGGQDEFPNCPREERRQGKK